MCLKLLLIDNVPYSRKRNELQKGKDENKNGKAYGYKLSEGEGEGKIER